MKELVIFLFLVFCSFSSLAQCEHADTLIAQGEKALNGRFYDEAINKYSAAMLCPGKAEKARLGLQIVFDSIRQQERRAKIAEEEAVKQRNLAISEKKLAEYEKKVAQSSVIATEALKGYDHTLTLRLAELAWILNPQPNPPVQIQSVLAQAFYIPVLEKQLFYNNMKISQVFEDVVFSPNSKKFAVLNSENNEFKLEIWDLEKGEAIPNFIEHTGNINYFTFSPNGKLLATTHTNDLEWSDYDELNLSVWDLEKRRLIYDSTLHLGNLEMQSLNFSSNGEKLIIFNSEDEKWEIGIIDINSGKQILNFVMVKEEFEGLVFSPDTKTVAITFSEDYQWKVNVIDINSGELIHDSINNMEYFESLVFSPDGKNIVTVNRDSFLMNEIIIWDAYTGEKMHAFLKFEGSVNSVGYSLDGNKIITTGGDFDSNWSKGDAKIWNAKTNRLLIDLETVLGSFQKADFYPNGNIIVITSIDSVKVWCIKENRIIHELIWDNVNRVEVSPDGKKLIRNLDDQGKKLEYIQLIDIKTGEVLGCMEVAPFLIKFASDGSKVLISEYISFYKQQYRIWDLNLVSPIKKIIGHSEKINSIDISSDGSWLCTASDDNSVKIWDTKSKKLKCSINNLKGDVQEAKFSSDGSKILTRGEINFVEEMRVWNVKTGELIFSKNIYDESFYDVEISSNESYIKTYIAKDIYFRKVQTWDIETGENIPDGQKNNTNYSEIVFNKNETEMVTKDSTTQKKFLNTFVKTYDFHENSDENYSKLFSPDGKKFVTTTDNLLVMWEASSGDPIYCFKRYYEGFFDMVFSPDGDKIVVSYDDTTAIVRDVFGGDSIFSLTGNYPELVDVIFSPNMKKVISVSDLSARVWDINSGQHLFDLSDTENGQHFDLSNTNNFLDDVKFISDEVIATDFSNGTKLWNAVTGDSIPNKRNNSKVIDDFSAGESRNFVCYNKIESGKHIVHIRDTRTNMIKKITTNHSNYINRVKFSTDEGKIITFSDYDENIDKTIVWDAVTGGLITEIKHSSKEDLRRLPTGDKIIFFNEADSDEILIYDIKSGDSIQLKGKDAIYSSERNEIIILGDTSICVLNGNSKDTIHDFNGYYPEESITLILSPKGNRITTLLEDSAILWDVNSGDSIWHFHDLPEVEWAIFSPDENFILTYDNGLSGRGGTIKIWDIGKKEQKRLIGTKFDVYDATFFKDNSTVVIVRETSEPLYILEFWDVKTGIRIVGLPINTVSELDFAISNKDDELFLVDESNINVFPTPIGIINWLKTANIYKLTNIDFEELGLDFMIKK